jgi:hypothetical protein
VNFFAEVLEHVARIPRSLETAYVKSGFRASRNYTDAAGTKGKAPPKRGKGYPWEVQMKRLQLTRKSRMF